VSNGGDNLKVTNCNIHHISGASNGPCAGIDCEPDDPATAVNITVTGNTIEDCSGPGVLVWLDSSNITIEDNNINRCSRAVLINEGVTGTFKGNNCRNNRNPAKFQNGSTSWVVGGAAANDADNNTFFKTGSTVTSGNTTTLHGESSATAKHLDIDNSSSATVLYNKYG
jgi:parallel beta-helix repeat protein